MTENFNAIVIAASIAATPPTLGVAVAIWKIKRVHHELNSRLTEWKEETKAATVAAVIAAYEKGVSDEKDKNQPTKETKS